MNTICRCPDSAQILSGDRLVVSRKQGMHSLPGYSGKFPKVRVASAPRLVDKVRHHGACGNERWYRLIPFDQKFDHAV